MQIPPFTIEQFFAVYEFTTPYILCASDCESMSVGELLQLANAPVERLLELRLGYAESQGGIELRTAVSHTYTSVHPDEIVILTAPEEGIYLTMRTLLEPGDHVVVLTPAYDSLLNMAQHVSGNVSQWQIQPTASGWQIDLNQLESLVTPQTRLIIVNFPHNPTGFLPNLPQLQAIIAIAQRQGAWLFCDEMYRGLEINNVQQLPSAADLYERAIVLSGLSKVHGLPGLRSGWLVLRDKTVREELINWKHYTTICPPNPSELLATVALSVQAQLAGRNRQLIEQNVQIGHEFFGRWTELFEWRPPQAGSVALVGLKRPSATAYCHQLAKDAGVLLLPSSCLGYGDGHIRMGFGRANFATNLEQYEQYLKRET